MKSPRRLVFDKHPSEHVDSVELTKGLVLSLFGLLDEFHSTEEASFDNPLKMTHDFPRASCARFAKGIDASVEPFRQPSVSYLASKSRPAQRSHHPRNSARHCQHEQSL
jgi:hypothetical protein